MKLRNLNKQGFTHDLLAVFVVVAFAIGGVAYLVGVHAANASGGPITSALLSGSTHLCLNAGGKINAYGLMNVEKCQTNKGNTQNWLLSKTQLVTPPGSSKQVQAYSINLGSNGSFCVGVDAPNGQLALTAAMLKQDKNNLDRKVVTTPAVQLFSCRQSNKSFTSSFQQWAVGSNNTLINVNPMATPQYGTSVAKKQMCMTANGNGLSIVLAQCNSPASNGQQWAVSSYGTGTGSVQPTTPTSVTATANSSTSVTVKWQASTDKGGPGVGGYYVLRGGTQIATVAGASTLTYTDTSLSPSTTYQYQVEAYDTNSTRNVSQPSASVLVTTESTTTSSGGTCIHPTWSSSDAEATDPIGIADLWWVNNDAWSGSHGPQTMYVCSQSSWYAVSNQPNVGGQVETYPDTEYDIGGRGNNTKKTITQFNTISSTFSESYPAAGSWDAAYDLWTNNWTNETMIWNQWAGADSYWPGQAKTALTLDGVAYHFLDNGGELMFFRDTPVTSGSVDILAAYQWEVAHGYAKSTDVPTQLEYGVEVCSTSGSETFPMNGLTFIGN